jgi:hypothetical protein
MMGLILIVIQIIGPDSDVEDDDDSDYIVVAKPNNPGGTYVHSVPPPTPPTECMWDSCNPVSQTPIITVIKKLLTNIRDVIFPQAQECTTPVDIT